MKKFRYVLALLLAVIAATCFVACNNCEHDWVEKDRVSATCSSVGTLYRECKKCGAIESEEIAIDATAHGWVEVGRDNATCTADGEVRYECKYCDQTKAEVLSSDTAHVWNETGRKAPTCTEQGEINYECELCETPKQDVLPVDLSAHVYGNEYERDYDSHWQKLICSHKDAAIKETHNFVDGVCSVCSLNESEREKAEFESLMADYLAFSLTQGVGYENTNYTLKGIWGKNTEYYSVLTNVVYAYMEYQIEMPLAQVGSETHKLENWLYLTADYVEIYEYDHSEGILTCGKEILEQRPDGVSFLNLYSIFSSIFENATFIEKIDDGKYAFSALENFVERAVVTFVDGKVVYAEVDFEYDNDVRFFTITYGDAVIPRHPDDGHAWVEIEKIQPTCCEMGFIKYDCSHCEDVKEEFFAPPDESKHVWVEQEKQPANCENTGYIRYECDNCEQWDYEDLPIDENTHVYSKYYEYDAEYHWQQVNCDHGAAAIKKEKHNFVDDVCSVCEVSESALLKAEWDALVENYVEFAKTQICFEKGTNYKVTDIGYGDALDIIITEDGYYTYFEMDGVIKEQWIVADGEKYYTYWIDDGEFGFQELDDYSLVEEPLLYTQFGYVLEGATLVEKIVDGVCTITDVGGDVVLARCTFDGAKLIKMELCYNNVENGYKRVFDITYGDAVIPVIPQVEYNALVESYVEFAKTQICFEKGTNYSVKTVANKDFAVKNGNQTTKLKGSWSLMMFTENAIFSTSDDLYESTIAPDQWYYKTDDGFMWFYYYPDKEYGKVKESAEENYYYNQALLNQFIDMFLKSAKLIERIDENTYVLDYTESWYIKVVFADGKLAEMSFDYDKSGDYEESYIFTYGGVEIPTNKVVEHDWDDTIGVFKRNAIFQTGTMYTITVNYDGEEFSFKARGNTLYYLDSDGNEGWVIYDDETYKFYEYYDKEWTYQETTELPEDFELQFLEGLIPLFEAGEPTYNVNRDVYTISGEGFTCEFMTSCGNRSTDEIKVNLEDGQTIVYTISFQQTTIEQPNYNK